MLLQDDPNRDGLGSALGVATTNGTFNPTTPSDPLSNGPFGTVGTINQAGNTGHLDLAGIISTGGTICGTDESGRVTMACWDEGAFAPNSGSLTIFSDVDLISGIFGGANFDPLNDKGRLALNTVAFHMEDEISVPEPGSFALLALGLAGIGLARRRKA